MSVSNTIIFQQFNLGNIRSVASLWASNPIYGYAHFNQLLSEHQKEANYIRSGYGDLAPRRGSGC